MIGAERARQAAVSRRGDPRSRPANSPAAVIASTPLSEGEHAWAEGVGRRLRAEFTSLISKLPAHERTAAGLERVLGTNRAVAHRLLSALAAHDDLEILTKIPGAEGLRKIIDAAERKLGKPVKSVLAGAESALAEFQELIRRAGGSHAKLVARIQNAGESADLASIPPGRRDATRHAMHDAVQALCGRQVLTRSSISIIRPNPDRPDVAEYVHARGFIGYRAAPGALPLVLGSWVTNADSTCQLDVDYRDLNNTPIEGREVTGLIEDFCTTPLPLVASRDTSGRLSQIVDRSGIEPGVSMDAVIAYRLPSVGPIPSRLDPPIFLEAVNATTPTENLVADFYFHRSMMQGCTPALNLYLGRGSGNCDLIDRWHEQIAGGPVLGLLGPGIGNAHASAWSRHAELTRRVFSTLNWNPSEYVGFRCEERWPLWHCDYVMSLDYRRGPDPLS